MQFGSTALRVPPRAARLQQPKLPASLEADYEKAIQPGCNDSNWHRRRHLGATDRGRRCSKSPGCATRQNIRQPFQWFVAKDCAAGDSVNLSGKPISMIHADLLKIETASRYAKAR
jgi:hypothetical protein